MGMTQLLGVSWNVSAARLLWYSRRIILQRCGWQMSRGSRSWCESCTAVSQLLDLVKSCCWIGKLHGTTHSRACAVHCEWPVTPLSGMRQYSRGHRTSTCCWKLLTRRCPVSSYVPLHLLVHWPISPGCNTREKRLSSGDLEVPTGIDHLSILHATPVFVVL
jgi:hypothetical protein